MERHSPGFRWERQVWWEAKTALSAARTKGATHPAMTSNRCHVFVSSRAEVTQVDLPGTSYHHRSGLRGRRQRWDTITDQTVTIAAHARRGLITYYAGLLFRLVWIHLWRVDVTIRTYQPTGQWKLCKKKCAHVAWIRIVTRLQKLSTYGTHGN